MNTLLWVLLFFIWNNNVLVHGKPPLEIENDDRKVFDVASFGYLKGGQLNLTLENYQLSNITSPGATAFYIRKGHTFSSVFTEDSIRPVIDGPFCFLENSFVKDEIEDQLAIVKELPDDNSKPWETTIIVGEGEEGIWEVLYVNCKDSLVSFKLTVTQVNPGNSHLSAGDSPLPFVYGLSAVAYIIVAIYWASLLTKGNDTKVFRAHWLMLILVIIIVINKALQSAKYHYMKIGVLSEGWSIGFYIFASIRGLLSIIIIVLLASGWMFIKPFLSSKDKTIISIVVPLQILANVAKAIGNEAAMGSVDWPFWNSLFPLIDLVACGIILWTILQTRKTLSAGTSADGKENDILNKYRLWSSFYLVTLVYIYITRIIVQLLQAALPFQYVTWLGEAVNETATLLFYIFIGWKFRPYANNPYMQIATDEIDDEEETDYTTINQGSVRLQSLSRRE